MGYEYYDNTVEIWGPFVLEYNVKVLNNLWNKIKEKINNNCKYITNVNENNINAIEFYKNHNFKFVGKGLTMTLNLKKYNMINSNKGMMLSQYDTDEFINLHDKIFPETYYNGKDIINMLDENNVVYIIKEDNKLVGYIFLTIDRNCNEGDIEFIGVKEMYRQKGYGRKLMNIALNYFKKNSISSLQLWVNYNDKKAIGLYSSVGFKLNDILVNYKK